MSERYLLIGGVLIMLAAVLGYRLLRRRSKPQQVASWFGVTFDDSGVRLSAQPPGAESWVQSFLWSEVDRVCFRSEGLSASDGIYVFTSKRPESYVVPIEAQGGQEFWSALIDRGLFPAERSIRAAQLPEGGTLCWPEVPHNEEH